jgi:hypothetical protein
MAALKHDKDGFLQGEPVAIESQNFAKALEVWSSIKSDTAAIRAALTGSKEGTKTAATPTPRITLAPVIAFPVRNARPDAERAAPQLAERREVVRAARAPQPRDSLGRFVVAPSQPVINAGSRFATPVPVDAVGDGAVPVAVPVAAPVVPQDVMTGAVPVAIPVPANKTKREVQNRERGSDGRFAGDPKDEGSSRVGGDGPLGRAADAISNAAGELRGLTDGTEQIDPAIAATKEVGDIVKPAITAASSVAKSVFGFFGKKDDPAAEAIEKTIPWHKRIFKVLRSIETASNADVGGGGGLLAMIFGGLMAAIGSGVAAVKSLPLMIGRMVGGFGGFLKVLGWAGKVIGKLALPAMMIYSAFKSLFTSTEEFAKRMGMNAGEGFFKDLAIRFMGTLGDLGNTITFGLAGKFGEAIAPAVASMVEGIVNAWNGALDGMAAVWQGITDTWNFTIDWWKGAWDSSLGAVVEVVDAVKNWLSNKVGGAKKAVSETWSAVKGSASEAWDKAKSAVGKVLETGAGYNVVQRPDGTVERQEGARNWRNNNPGNIEAGDFATKMGAVGTDGRFAIFPDYQTGRSAKEKLIFEGGNYKNKTLTEAIARYAPAGENDTGRYQKTVLGAVGGANKPMAEYTPQERGAIMDAMERVEGFQVGRTSVLSRMSSTAPSLALPRLPPFSATAALSGAARQVPAAPATAMPLASNAGAPNVNVRLPQELSQNVSDRGVAHIATGGMGYFNR